MEAPNNEAPDDSAEAATPSREHRGVTRCRCAWDLECRSLRRGFQNAGDALRGGRCFEADLSGDSEREVLYREAVLRHLGRTVDDYPNIKRVLIAKHHYDPRQLALFQENRKSRLKQLAQEEVIKYTMPCLLENSPTIHDKAGRSLYFHLPNYPKEKVINDLEEAQIEFERRQARLAALTPDDLYQMETELATLKHRLTEEREQSNKKIAALQSELLDVRKVNNNLDASLQHYEKTVAFLQSPNNNRSKRA